MPFGTPVVRAGYKSSGSLVGIPWVADDFRGLATDLRRSTPRAGSWVTPIAQVRGGIGPWDPMRLGCI